MLLLWYTSKLFNVMLCGMLAYVMFYKSKCMLLYLYVIVVFECMCCPVVFVCRMLYVIVCYASMFMLCYVLQQTPATHRNI